MKYPRSRQRSSVRRVAPARERGLKLFCQQLLLLRQCRRSREGAWIEIRTFVGNDALAVCRSREGAWIEMLNLDLPKPIIPVAPARERGLKCRSLAINDLISIMVAPARERGLK